MKEYNELRTHKGKHSFGKKLLETFVESKHFANEKMLDRLELTASATV